MNILNQVDLTPRAVAAYHEFAQHLALTLCTMGIRPSEISEEQAEEKPDGNLVVYIDLPHGKGRVEFIVPSSDWAWRNRN